jgi:hypothetical protein
LAGSTLPQMAMLWDRAASHDSFSVSLAAWMWYALRGVAIVNTLGRVPSTLESPSYTRRTPSRLMVPLYFLSPALRTAGPATHHSQGCVHKGRGSVRAVRVATLGVQPTWTRKR